MENMQKEFNKFFDHYWYKNKSISERLLDSMETEMLVCAKFFETLNELGQLDKCYPITKLSTHNTAETKVSASQNSKSSMKQRTTK